MKRRRWVLVLFGVFFLLIGGLSLFNRLFRLDDRFRDFLLEQIGPYVAPESTIRSAWIDLSSIHLEGVHLVSHDGALRLDIEDLRVGYNLFRLIRHGFKPLGLVREVLIVRPCLVLREKKVEETSFLTQESSPGFHEVLSAFPGIQRITIRNGALFLENLQGRKIRFAHRLNGWFLALPADSAEIHLAGRLFDSAEENLEVAGVLDFHSGRWIALDAVLRESLPPPEIPLLLPPFIRVSEGRMWGDARYRRGVGATGSFVLEGAAFDIQKSVFSFRGVGIRADLSGRSLRVVGHVDDFNGGPLRLEGTVRNLFDPHLAFRIVSDSLALDRFWAKTMPGLSQISGQIHYGLEIRGRLDSLELTGELVGDPVHVAGLDWQLESQIGLKDSRLSLKGRLGHQGGAFLRYNAGLLLTDPHDPLLSATVQIEGPYQDLFPEPLRERIQSLEGPLMVRIGGKMSNPWGRLAGRLLLTTPEERELRLEAALSYGNHRATGEIRTSDLFSVQLKAEKIFTPRARWNLNARRLESLAGYFTDAKIQNWLEGLSTTLSLMVDHKGWTLLFSGMDLRKTPPSLLVKTWIEAKKIEARHEGRIRSLFYAQQPSDSLLLTSRFLIAKGLLSIEDLQCDGIQGKIDLPLGTGVPEGKIQLESVSLSRFHPWFPILRPFTGLLQGGVVFAREDGPQRVAQIRLIDGTLFGRGLYEASYEGAWDGKGLRRLVSFLSHNDRPIVSLDLSRGANDSLIGRCIGKDLVFGPEGIRLSPDGTFIQGSGAFEAVIYGPVAQPIVEGTLSFADVRVGPLPLRTLDFRFRDAVDSTRGRVLKIEEGHGAQGGVTYQITGQIPHSTDEEARLDLLAEGNLFEPLNQVTSAFEKTQADGTLKLMVGGRPGAWELAGGELTLRSGSLKPNALVRRLDRIRGHAWIDPERRYVAIDSLVALLDGEPLCIRNVASMNGMTPFVFEPLGLSIGILTLTTEGRGVPMSIPGLMESGDRGFFHFRGFSPGRPFLIAGPTSHPLVEGEIRVSSCRLTYPFLKGKSKGGRSPLVNALEKITWNVRVVPDKDVRYVRSIESLFGNVFLDLQLRERFGEMTFQGILEEDTFEAWGRLASTEGSLEVLNRIFRPEEVSFDYPKGAVPLLRGRAYTTVIDSMGIPSTIWLVLGNRNPTLNDQGQGGALDEIVFRLETDNPNLGRTEADLYAVLGYSESQIKDRAYDAIGLQLENWVFRPLLRPIERQLRKRLGLDVIRVSSMIGRNLMSFRGMEQEWLALDPRWLLRSTRVTVGKYLAPGLFLIYSGQVQNEIGLPYRVTGLGFRHAVSLEYAIRPDLFLEMEYTYDSQLLSERREDKRVWVRHVFPF